MVSLVNFKIVSDELQQQQHQHLQLHQQHETERTRDQLKLQVQQQSAPVSIQVMQPEGKAESTSQTSSIVQVCQRPSEQKIRKNYEPMSSVSIGREIRAGNRTNHHRNASITHFQPMPVIGTPETSNKRPRQQQLSTAAAASSPQEQRFQSPKQQQPTQTQNIDLMLALPVAAAPPSNDCSKLYNVESHFNAFCDDPKKANEISLYAGAEVPNFVVTWRSLRFAIEPKWHQRLPNFGGPMAALASKMVPANINNLSQVSRTSQCPATRVVLDRLDGSFRSGELTAILGPSGAGKTTLLDCLTGHRKHGLSGSIKISTSSSSFSCSSAINTNHKSSCGAGGDDDALARPATHQRYFGAVEHSASESQISGNKNLNLTIASSAIASQQLATGCMKPATAKSGAGASNPMASPSSGRGNLKVSIIPQNDHLIGHLTVYETLNYASKMKNCFDRNFNHKLNIKRIAQQLGLMTCLGTRINKLSGGQYKRVSIAQELLSSPDILILDEPTSGLDAMTCYQTVQVLRKLTDERQSNGLKQIAVILTIHQPNSDVFQQFNHVYVVAQGGKCIYEGPPANIESVINRVGIRLPNSHYNPATMIVEIAAGKFGQDAIQKLNAIQKKQYDFVVPDEQNSTGDSAVDCPSSSSSSNDDEDDLQGVPRKGDKTQDRGGLVNKGFEMDNEADVFKARDADDNNNSSSTNTFNGDSNNNCRDVVVVVAKDNGDEDVDSVDRIKMMNCDSEGRRKRRRKTRKRASDSAATNGVPGADSDGHLKQSRQMVAGNGGGGPPDEDPKREKRVKLNSLKADQKFPFWRHTYLHFHRSWLSIVRDPMLCSMQLALHIIVPLMVSLVYGTNVGKPNACPRAGPVDIMAYALEPTDSALQLQEDLRTTLENIGYIFFKLYGIIFAAMTVTVLTFPLDMHVLVKEFRNGWYGLSSYFLGRTLADVPFQLTLPLLAMSLSYYATGQPYSYMQWRFLSITAILILSSLIAQSQGLLFGAILMDKMKAAVFVAPAATTPIILFAGFLVRTQSIPRYLRPLSNLSYLRYAIEACLISRYGFNQCECDPAVFNQSVPELPPIARSMLDYWLSSFKPAPASEGTRAVESLANSTMTSLIETTTAASSAETPDLFTKLIDSLARANSFGRNITSCEQVVPYPMIDYDLKDSQLATCFAILIFILVFTRLLTFFIVCFKVKRKV